MKNDLYSICRVIIVFSDFYESEHLCSSFLLNSINCTTLSVFLIGDRRLNLSVQLNFDIFEVTE